MNRRQLLTAGAASVASLLVPAAVQGRPKYPTLEEYVKSLHPDMGLDTLHRKWWKRWMVLICHFDSNFKVPIWQRFMWTEKEPFEWKGRDKDFWLYTADGPRRIDRTTTELIPFQPVVGSVEECWSYNYEYTAVRNTVTGVVNSFRQSIVGVLPPANQ